MSRASRLPTDEDIANWRPHGGGRSADDDERSLWTAQGRTDVANSSRFLAENEGDLLFCPATQRWHLWDGCCWQPDEARLVEDKAKEIGRLLFGEISDAAAQREIPSAQLPEAIKWARHTASGRGIREMLHLARSTQKVIVMPAQLDADPNLLAVGNGTIDLRTGRLRPHCREDRITRTLATVYAPDAKAPTWEKFIAEVFADDAGRPKSDLIAFVQRSLGYTLTGQTSERCLFFAHGRGANGKTTLISTIEKLLGSYATAITTEMLTTERRGIPTETLDLMGVRMAVASETEHGSRFAESFIKQITGGGDTLKGRRLFCEHTQFPPTHKLWLAGNHKPRIRGRDLGIWDRIRLIPFERRFTNPDRELSAKLSAERPGILTWCVRGCLEWRRMGLGTPTEVTEATESYKAECDTVGQFVEEECVTERERRIRAGVLYGAYKAWCSRTEVEAVSLREFGEAIEEAGFEKKKSGGVWYCGLDLRSDEP